MAKHTLKIEVELDEDKMPKNIHWDAQGMDPEDAKAFFLAMYNGEKQETLRVDLWVKDMQKNEMQHFMYNNLMSVGRTYARATGDEGVIEMFDEFAKKIMSKEVE